MIKDILNKAKNFCTKNKHRFTDPRKKVLRIIASSKKPIKAYEVLDKQRFNRKSKTTNSLQSHRILGKI